MNNTEKRLEKVDWREIDFAIMYFQVHVRKVTGGNDFGFVDATELKSAIKQTFTTSIQEALAEDRERVRNSFEQLEVIKKSWENIEKEGNPNEITKTQIFGFNQCYKIVKQILSSLKDKQL